jgi:protoporphyrinogen/coproporphyrinogen III oxidase
MHLDDVELLAIVRTQLRNLMGIEAPPAFHRIHRWPAGSPQYDVGHLDRIAEIETLLPDGIFVTGGAYRGIGIPDIARDAAAIASNAFQHVEERFETTTRPLIHSRARN